MAIISRKPKMNDFRVASMTRNHVIDYRDAYRGSLAFTIGSKGTYYSANRDDDHIYVYHVEKKRAKFAQTKSRSGSATWPLTVTQSTKVRDIEWTVRVFKFPKAIVKSVKQHKRHFDLVLAY